MADHGRALTAATVSTAHHESAHALAFLVCGAPFEYATIRLPGGGGLVAVDAWPTDPRVRAIVSHAGPLAEARHREILHRGPGPLWEGESDRHERDAYNHGGRRDLDVIRHALTALRLTDD